MKKKKASPVNKTHLLVVIFLVGLDYANSLAPPQVPPPRPIETALLGSWTEAKTSLRSPNCCVVSVSGLGTHLQAIQTAFADNGPMDIDLRRRIRGSHLTEDCLKLQQSILGDDNKDDAVTSALMEIARGSASLADGPLEGVCEDIFLRVVCASDYKARDPMFHTDKCPIRGYVTLRGVGTEFRTNICSPLEYAALRGLGTQGNSDNLRRAEELEFIVMKGDHYKASNSDTSSWWTRASTCVHRSPPGNGGRRVILSFDLAAGEDDREWYQANKKREWRSGMTQRKSRLVA